MRSRFDNSLLAPTGALADWALTERTAAHAVARDHVLGLALATAIAVLCALGNSDCQHWFLIPVVGCGGLCIALLLKWLRGGCDLLDPTAIVAMVGVHLFFSAPLLHVLWGYETPYVESPADWRPWIGGMAALNFLGLLLFRLTAGSAEVGTAATTYWRLQETRFVWLTSAAILGCTVLQLSVYAKAGGISGYIQSFSESSDEFSGMGFVFMFSESVPILSMFLMVLWARRSPARQTLFYVGGLLCAFIALKLFFGGLRGSRGHILYGVFWAVALVHYTVRPLPKKLILSGVVAALLFVYLYGFYKTYGQQAIGALLGRPDAQAELADESSRRLEGVILGDLSRCDIQAQLLYRLSGECPELRYEYKLGGTYVGSLALLIPRSIIGERPPSKVKAGTDLLFGPDSYETDMISTFAFGLSGEAMLNFGTLGAVVAFGVIGLYTRFIRDYVLSLAPDDSRQLMLPLIGSLAFMALLWDSDVLLFYVIKEGIVPGALVFVCSIGDWPLRRHSEACA